LLKVLDEKFPEVFLQCYVNFSDEVCGSCDFKAWPDWIMFELLFDLRCEDVGITAVTPEQLSSIAAAVSAFK
jgi:hypothetical protein